MDAGNHSSTQFDVNSATPNSDGLSVIVIASRTASPEVTAASQVIANQRTQFTDDFQRYFPTRTLQVLSISEDSAAAIASALDQCQHGGVAIVQDRLLLDAPLIHWCIADESGSEAVDCSTQSPNQVRLAVQTPAMGIGFWRWVMWLQYWTVRLCFGVKKAKLQPAIIYFSNASELKPILASTRIAESNTSKRPVLGREIKEGFDSILAAISVKQLPLLQAEFATMQIVAQAKDPIDRGWPAIDWKQEGYFFLSTLQRCWNWKWFPSANTSSLNNQEHEHTKTQPLLSGVEQPSLGLQLLGFIVLLVTTILVLGQNLNYPLFEPDEARNAQLALNIYETGDWVSLRLGSEYYWDKPPAVAWGTALSYHLFGVTPWATRLVSNLSAILTVILVFGFGRLVVGFRGAWLGAMLLVLSTGFVICGRYATMDAAITLCSCTVLSFSFLACPNHRFSYLLWTVAAFAAGVGFLVKGPVILVLTMPPLLSWMWLSKNFQLFRIVPWVYFGAIVALVAGPWFLAMGLEQPEFLVYFFWKHHVVRFSDAFNHREPFWYYGPVLCLGMFPASLLLPTLLAFFRRRNSEYQRISTPNLGFLLLWGGWVVGFFSMSDSKLPTYILPAFPALALLLGRTTEAFLLSQSENFAAATARATQVATDSKRRWPLWLQIPTLNQWLLSVPRRVAVSLIVAVVAYALVSLLLFKQSGLSTFTVIVGGAAILLTFFSWFDSAKVQIRILSTCAMAAMFVATIVTQVLPGVSKFRSIQAATAALHSQKELNDLPIVFFGHEDYGLQLAMPDQETVSFDENHVVNTIRFIQNHSRCLIVSNIASIEQLRCNLDYQFELASIKGARHVYLCHNNKQKDPAVEVIADRLKTFTLTR